MTAPAPSLKALAESKTEGVSKLTGFTIDPDLVHIEEGWNGREENDDLAAYRQRMKAAMKAGAFLPPIDVEMVEGRPVVRDGHSRTLMARELKAEGFEIVLQARQIRGNDAEMRYHMLGSGSARPLSPLEAGRQYLLLTRMGETVAQIAARLGQHRSTIENGLQLAEMPAAVQKMVGAGKVASHTALKTVKAHGKEAAGKLAEAVKAAESKGKKKATGKHIEPKPKKLPAGPAPAPRGQTLPPVDPQTHQIHQIRDQIRQIRDQAHQIRQIRDQALPPVGTAAMFELLHRLAAVNIIVSNLDRGAIEQLVRDARALLGVK